MLAQDRVLAKERIKQELAAEDSGLAALPQHTVRYMTHESLVVSHTVRAYGVSGNNISNFTGLEWCDIEAMYVDDDLEFIDVLIITSMPKN